MLGHQPLAVLARILAAAIGVMQQFARTSPLPHRHHECICDKLGGHGRAHRPADDAAREEIVDFPGISGELF